MLSYAGLIIQSNLHYNSNQVIECKHISMCVRPLVAISIYNVIWVKQSIDGTSREFRQDSYLSGNIVLF